MEIRVEIVGDKVDDEDKDEAAILVRTQSRVTMTKVWKQKFMILGTQGLRSVRGGGEGGVGGEGVEGGGGGE